MAVYFLIRYTLLDIIAWTVQRESLNSESWVVYNPGSVRAYRHECDEAPLPPDCLACYIEVIHDILMVRTFVRSYGGTLH